MSRSVAWVASSGSKPLSIRRAGSGLCLGDSFPWIWGGRAAKETIGDEERWKTDEIPLPFLPLLLLL